MIDRVIPDVALATSNTPEDYFVWELEEMARLVNHLMKGGSGVPTTVERAGPVNRGEILL